MKKTIVRQYVADAFTDKVFSGNPAAVCIMDQWLPEDLMMNITRENNLSETAFAVKENGIYHLRWFTPGGEIDLCGHATLACAFILLHYYEKNSRRIVFCTMSGDLTVIKNGSLYEMDFPAYDLKPVPVTEQIKDAAGAAPIEAYMGRDLLCIFEEEKTVRNLNPDLEKVKQLDGLLLHATAGGTAADCVSRSFAPKMNVAEDPVCGSGHCHIAPYWSRRLQKTHINACQASNRGGTLYCTVNGSRVTLAGKAVLYSAADLYL
ncbi:PhzF family phenazine biosynthesis protein [Anaerostipes sp.]|uniref:PhzF family phenazine biosynthesis protein n=1 Tax=Anaerostipes sp. TaxID=1872530 RepID=UPI0025BB59B5|nr:PhzF family phenazine biosynthesis protein [Anaerostipes sp.]MBS7009414.1 PhzF family phenazine biosynthesis protein [Anaerostipes sp.]